MNAAVHSKKESKYVGKSRRNVFVVRFMSSSLVIDYYIIPHYVRESKGKAIIKNIFICEPTHKGYGLLWERSVRQTIFLEGEVTKSVFNFANKICFDLNRPKSRF